MAPTDTTEFPINADEPQGPPVWVVSDTDLLDDEEFAESAETFSAYADLDFTWRVAQVADRIFAVHQERDVSAGFLFSLAGSVEGEIQGALVSCDLDKGPYLTRWCELRDLTRDPAAQGHAAAFAIRDALMGAYSAAREFAATHNLIDPPEGVHVLLHPSTAVPDATAVQIDTEPGARVVVYLNDGILFSGDPDDPNA